MPEPIIYFQWQNEFLLRTIYPLRETKLRDFLQYIFEIEIWQKYKNQNTDTLAGEIQTFKTTQKNKVLEAFNSFQRLSSYFLDEDVTDQFSTSISNLDLETMGKINDIHKVFKQFFPTYKNPVKEKYFTSERARQLEEMRKRNQAQLGTQQRLLKILPANSPQKPKCENEIGRLTTSIKMIDQELSHLYDFLKAFTRLDVYKQEALKRKTIRQKEREDTSAQLRLLNTETEALQETLLKIQRAGKRLSSPPNLEGMKSYFLDDDVSDLYKQKIPEIEAVTLQRINALHKTFKSIFPTYKNPISEKSFISQRIKEFEDLRKLRAQELAGKQRAASWIQPGTSGWDTNEKAINTLKNKVLRALDEELNQLYDLQWAYEAASKSSDAINALVGQNQKERNDIENQLKTRKENAARQQASLGRVIQELELGEKEQMLSLVDTLPVTVKDIVRGKVEAYKSELGQYTHDQLLGAIVKRFVDQPERYPLWLQYMVIHFSGMRYQSAHGSWADPKDLLLSLRIKAVQDEIKRHGEDVITVLCEERLQIYQSAGAAKASTETQTPPPALSLASEPRWKDRISQHLRALDPTRMYNRKKALMDLRIDEEDYEISRMTDKQALEQLEGMKDLLPDWMWKEIVKMTDLRLKEVRDENWEQVSTEDMAKRYTQQMAPYREILENWKRNHLTGWREEHDRSSQLIVTRAVCNEVAEHAQHIRGHSPSGGLTAKPEWYMRKEKEPRWATAGERPYLVKAKSSGDFKPGASILWLQWVNKEPNAWQIARPLVLKTGEELIPSLSDANARVTNTGSSFVRDARFQVKDASGAVVERNEHQWLRWLHEATVVDVTETMDGPTILTFETALPYEDRRQSTIGVFKHNAANLEYKVTASLMNGVFVGYVPEGNVSYEELHDMLDWNRVLLKQAYTAQQISQYWAKVTRPPAVSVSFESALFTEISQVETSPQIEPNKFMNEIICYDLNGPENQMEPYQPAVILRRGMRMRVNKGAIETYDGKSFYPVQKCDDEPRAEDLFILASDMVDAPEEGSSKPRKIKKEAELYQICGVDAKGKPVFENTGISLEKGTRLRISSVQKVNPSGSRHGLVLGKGRTGYYLILECPRRSSAEGLFIRASDLTKISEGRYRKTKLSF